MCLLGAVCQTPPPRGQAVTMHSSRMRTDWGGVCPTPLDADPHPVNRMTHAGENITVTQTSFAGGNHGHWNEERGKKRLWEFQH